jgi:hypothetical protein
MLMPATRDQHNPQLEDTRMNHEQILDQTRGDISEADSRLASVCELVANLQQQIDTLTAQIHQQSEPPTEIACQKLSLAPAKTIPNPIVEAQPPVSPPATSKGSPWNEKPHNRLSFDEGANGQVRSKFFGPTSPDYSLNVAQSRLRPEHNANDEKTNPAIVYENQSDHEEDFEVSYEENNSSHFQEHGMCTSVYERLLHFRTIIELREANRLLRIYQQAINEYHPLIDTDSLATQMSWWYSHSTVALNPGLSVADQNDLLVINLALAIALCAEYTAPGSKSFDMCKTIYFNCKDIIDAKLASPIPSVKQVVIMLLVVSTLERWGFPKAHKIKGIIALLQGYATICVAFVWACRPHTYGTRATQ